MTLTQLRALKAVAEHGSYSRAAEALFLSQPGVYVQVRALERACGHRLIEQVGRRATLTSAGQVLMRYAERVLSLLDEARMALDDTAEGEMVGHLTLGAGPLVTAYILPLLLHAYRRRYPRVDLRSHVLVPHEIDERLLSREIELGLHSGPPVRNNLVGERFYVEPLLLVVDPAHPLARRGCVALDELSAYPFVLSDNYPEVPPMLRDWLAGRGVTITAALNVPNESAARLAIRQGMGIGVISRSVIATDVAAGFLRIVPVDGLDLTREYYAVWRRESRVSRPLRAMIDLLQDPHAIGQALAAAGQTTLEPATPDDR